jgi:Domain of unknown function (DUF4160)/Protein of unknown function (DUF2442)
MRVMPRLSSFYGIVIYMYRPDHPPPHFHAQYGEHVAQIDVESLEVLNGSLPARALRLVREWAELHRAELAMNWDLAQALEPLVEIDPLPNIDHAMLRVTAVKPLDGYKLEISFDDGVVRVVDCSFLLHGTLGEPLKDLDYFRQVRVDHDARTIVWPNGLDPAPELLHDGRESIDALERHRTAA